jgi:uncharacterized protein YqhQ
LHRICVGISWRFRSWRQRRQLVDEHESCSPRFQAITVCASSSSVTTDRNSVIPEIRRVQYHGGAQGGSQRTKRGRAHDRKRAIKQSASPRCGTTFLVLVVMVSDQWCSQLLVIRSWEAGRSEGPFFFAEAAVLPVMLAAITYELQRSARYCQRGPLRLVLYPGFAVQPLPRLSPGAQLEVAREHTSHPMA